MKTNLIFLLLLCGIVVEGGFFVASLAQNAAEAITLSPPPVHHQAVPFSTQSLSQESSGVLSLEQRTKLRDIFAETDDSHRAELLWQWVLSLPLNQLERQLQVSGSLPNWHWQQEVRLAIVHRWLVENPTAAISVLQRLAAPSAQSPNGQTDWIEVLGLAAGHWSTLDPSRALAWAQALPAGPTKEAVSAQISTQLRNEAAQRAATNLADARAWANILPPGKLSTETKTLLATLWAHQDPVAAGLYATSLGTEGERNAAVSAVAGTWALTDPQRAAAWAVQLTSGSQHNEALEAVVTTWASSHPDEVAQWLQKLPASFERDAAITSYTTTIAQSYPGAAFEWADTIADEATRNRQLQQAAGYWLLLDPLTARSQVQQSSLPQDMKTRLIALAAHRRY